MVLQNPSDPLNPCFQPRQKPWVHSESRWTECFHWLVLHKVLPFQHLGNLKNINLFFFFLSYIFTQNPLVERNQNFLKNLIIQDLLKILGNNCLFFVLPRDLLYQHLGKKNRTCRLNIVYDLLIEPIGGTKPKFSQESELSQFTKRSGHQLSLLCPAQGSPVPAFR